ncbi:MAG: ImmA/IrrE family metallo-endopeptidase [Prevotellaceae bacterium]|jgi:HTH-type transcriptional regulator/antitoxin HigA|nr:ImmA/IrrE family metallo-endopeptidase [Prevotellaceae bacterium]
MSYINELKPFKPLGPGFHIQEDMDYRGWLQSDLAEVLGLSVKTVSQLISNKQPVTLETARLLSGAFGQSAQFWLNLETNYRLRLETLTEKQKATKRKSLIYEFMPISEMTKKRWLKKTNDVADLEKQVEDFWHKPVGDFSFMRQTELPVTYRKSKAYHHFSDYALQCWFQMAKNSAEKIKTPEYNKVKLEKLYAEINDYTVKTNGINLFLKNLMDCGVKFFVLSHLPKTYLDGASFFDKKNPVIVYTGRYKRSDNFWFTVAHEMAHVLRHLKKTDDYYLDDLYEKQNSKQEQEADALAQEKLKHEAIMQFFKDKMKYIAATDIEACAKKHHIAKSIIAGALVHEGQIPYTRLHKYNSDPFEIINRKYLVEET